MNDQRQPGYKRKLFLPKIQKKTANFYYDWFGDIPSKIVTLGHRLIKSPPIQFIVLLVSIIPNLFYVLLLTNILFLFTGFMLTVIIEELVDKPVFWGRLNLFINLIVITIYILLIVIKWIYLNYDVQAVKRDIGNLSFWKWAKK